MDSRRRDRYARYVVIGPRSPREARELVRRAVSDAHWCGDLDGAVLSVSELVTNAICHTGAVRRVEVTADERLLHVETADEGAGRPEPLDVGPDATSGRGLSIVAEISDAWGVRASSHGKVVWFEMAAGRPRARGRFAS